MRQIEGFVHHRRAAAPSLLTMNQRSVRSAGRTPTHDLGWWLVGKTMVDFIRLNWTFFAIYYGSGFMRRNVYCSAVYAGGRPLCTQILPGQGRPPSTILGIRKLDTGLPDGEDRIPLRSVVLAKYWRVTDRRTDRRTDGRICRGIYSACKAMLCGILRSAVTKRKINLY